VEPWMTTRYFEGMSGISAAYLKSTTG